MLRFSRAFNRPTYNEPTEDEAHEENRFQGQNLYETASTSIEIDQNENICKCHVCGKLCKNKVGLSSHMRTHAKKESTSVS